MTTSFIQDYTKRVNGYLSLLLSYEEQKPAHLYEAIRYVCAGGKRIRACLVYAAAELFPNTSSAILDKLAASVELIHAYSLVHDDLPAIDNDALRRGQPTCHIAFDEATAILVGDALQTLAFEVITTSEPGINPQQLLSCVHLLAKASGAMGMIAGQAFDLQAVGKNITLRELDEMHRLKTGALISASVTLGALASPHATPPQLDALHTFGETIGLAFQIQDDILDAEGVTEVLGKTAKADEALNKPTYVSLMGLEQAKIRAENLYLEALDELAPFGEHAKHLRDIAHFIVHRAM